MSELNIPLPFRGFSSGIAHSDTGTDTSAFIRDVRPRDTLSGRLRLGQRPGLTKFNANLIPATATVVDAICYITIMWKAEE
jgi:hypothetical protein